MSTLAPMHEMLAGGAAHFDAARLRTSLIAQLRRSHAPVELDLAKLLADGGELDAGQLFRRRRYQRKVDVARRVMVAYDDTVARPSHSQEVSTAAYLALALVFAVAAQAIADAEPRALAHRLQWANSVFHALDHVPSAEADELAAWMLTQVEGWLPSLAACWPTGVTNAVAPPHRVSAQAWATPLTVLVQEGPMARAYLAVLHAMGYPVKHIVLMVQRRDLATGRPVAPWLPTRLRMGWCARVQDWRANHWPRVLRRRHASWCEPWLHTLTRHLGLDSGVLDAITGPPAHRRWAQTCEAVMVDGLGDPALFRRLGSLPAGTLVLFTGGGMVPASLLGLPGLRFMHVHPGHLPEVRGADGLFWSWMLRGKPGATAFYMSPGLDTGDIIWAADLPLPPLPAPLFDLDIQQAYRLLYSFVDPLLRAAHLGQVLAQASAGSMSALTGMAATTQLASDGETFHFMHAHLRRASLARMRMTMEVGRPAGQPGV